MPARVEAAMLEARAAVLTRRSLTGPALHAALDIACGCLDLTTLAGTDTPQCVRALCARAAAPGPGLPAVAAVCVAPARVADAVAALRGTSVRVASVAGAASGLGSRASKLADVHAALEAGAHEIELVLDRAALLAGEAGATAADIAAVRATCGGATLKVILEAGELGSYAAVRRAADAALGAGADFVKTSTGTLPAPATPGLVLLLCEAIREHARRTGRAAGLEVAGGIGTARAALGVLAIAFETLGAQWLVPGRLRFGAAALLDDLLHAYPARA